MAPKKRPAVDAVDPPVDVPAKRIRQPSALAREAAANKAYEESLRAQRANSKKKKAPAKAAAKKTRNLNPAPSGEENVQPANPAEEEQPEPKKKGKRAKPAKAKAKTRPRKKTPEVSVPEEFPSPEAEPAPSAEVQETVETEVQRTPEAERQPPEAKAQEVSEDVQETAKTSKVQETPEEETYKTPEKEAQGTPEVETFETPEEKAEETSEVEIFKTPEEEAQKIASRVQDQETLEAEVQVTPEEVQETVQTAEDYVADSEIEEIGDSAHPNNGGAPILATSLAPGSLASKPKALAFSKYADAMFYAPDDYHELQPYFWWEYFSQARAPALLPLNLLLAPVPDVVLPPRHDTDPPLPEHPDPDDVEHVPRSAQPRRRPRSTNMGHTSKPWLNEENVSSALANALRAAFSESRNKETQPPNSDTSSYTIQQRSTDEAPARTARKRPAELSFSSDAEPSSKRSKQMLVNRPPTPMPPKLHDPEPVKGTAGESRTSLFHGIKFVPIKGEDGSEEVPKVAEEPVPNDAATQDTTDDHKIPRDGDGDDGGDSNKDDKSDSNGKNKESASQGSPEVAQPPPLSPPSKNITRSVDGELPLSPQSSQSPPQLAHSEAAAVTTPVIPMGASVVAEDPTAGIAHTHLSFMLASTSLEPTLPGTARQASCADVGCARCYDAACACECHQHTGQAMFTSGAGPEDWVDFDTSIDGPIDAAAGAEFKFDIGQIAEALSEAADSPPVRRVAAQPEGLETPGSWRIGPRTPEPKTPEPKTPDLRTPGPRTPGLRTPWPKTPEPKTPGSRQSTKSLALQNSMSGTSSNEATAAKSRNASAFGKYL